MRWIYLTISVLAISVGFLLYELNRLDGQYSELIDNGTEGLNMLQRLTFNSNRRHILLFYVAHTKDTVAKDGWIRERESLQKENDSIFSTLIRIKSAFPEYLQIINEVSQARHAYLVKTQMYLEKARTSGQSFRDDQADHDLDASFLEYQKKVNSLYSHENKSVRTLSNLFSSSVEKKSIWISLFSVSPFMIIAILFAVLIILLRYVSASSPER